MYFKIPKSSPTGQKLTALLDRMRAANDQAQKLIESFGAVQFRPGYWAIGGGVSSIIFPEGKPEKSERKHWKKGAQNGEYLPAERTPQGKEMTAQIEALPRVLRGDLNSILGYKHLWNVVGIQWNHGGNYFLVNYRENWEYDAPADAIELTHSEWKVLSQAHEKESEVPND
jgi:hypothetical protein